MGEVKKKNYLMSHLVIFLKNISLGKGNKTKNKQMGLHQAKTFLHSEQIHQQNENKAY